MTILTVVIRLILPMKFLFLTLYLLVSSTGYVEAIETKETKGILYDLESGEPFTGEITYQDDNDKQDILYLIYGHEFNYRVMKPQKARLWIK